MAVLLLDPTKAVKAGPADARRCEGDRGFLGAARRLCRSLDLDLLLDLRFMNLAVGTALVREAECVSSSGVRDDGHPQGRRHARVGRARTDPATRKTSITQGHPDIRVQDKIRPMTPRP